MGVGVPNHKQREKCCLGKAWKIKKGGESRGRGEVERSVLRNFDKGDI